MKHLILFLFVFLPFTVFSQISESFADGNFTENPTWTGNTESFVVNTSQQLQSSAATTSVSYLSTPCTAFVNATWECSVKIDYTTSSSNYACFYIATDSPNILNECTAFYVQVGGTSDEVSLYVLQNNKRTKIIDGTDKRTDGKPVDIRIKLTRDIVGNFTLYSKTATESEYVKEGSVLNNVMNSSSYIALLYSNTATTGNAYFFDNISVTGDKAPDNEAPTWQKLSIKAPNQMILDFSEAVNADNATFSADHQIGNSFSHILSENRKQLTLAFEQDFEKGILYELTISGLTDITGNALTNNRKTAGVTEIPATGDIFINEIMFNAPENGAEYVELINTTGKVLDVSGLIITTRNQNNTLNSGNKISDGIFIAPNGYAAFTPDAQTVLSYHNCPPEASVISMNSWSALNNETATIVLTNSTKDSIFDEVTYSENWHHAMIRNRQGVALERVHPFLSSRSPDTWHSAASEVNFGTPGYKNSQYRDIYQTTDAEKYVWTEPEAFSPDNDGYQDQCLIHYRTPTEGYIGKSLIFNSTGYAAKEFFSNQLLSTDGFILWDGTGDKNNILPSGIYVLYFEMIHPVTGDKKMYKLPIVLSSR